MRMVFEVAEVTQDDWRMWRELRLTALTDAPDAFASTLAEWRGAGDTEERWRGRLEDVALNLVITRGGEAVGMVSATAPDNDRPIAVMAMWVAPASRGHGVGDEAIRNVLAWAGEHFPMSGITLSVKANNQHAIRLFERHGFVDVGPSPAGSDQRLMRL